VYNERAAHFGGVGIPVLVAGRNVEPAVAEACLQSGVDLVAMTRAIIADPDLPLKIGSGARKRPCISLNEGCIGRLYTGLPMWCSVNPAIREPELGQLAPASEPKRIVVVGAGVAGLEAARGAAVRGHHVIVWERRDVVGGRARLAAERKGGSGGGSTSSGFREEASDAGVEIRLGAEVDGAAVLAERPDAVILATDRSCAIRCLPMELRCSTSTLRLRSAACPCRRRHQACARPRRRRWIPRAHRG
jgi:NADPH-dependent 2,4-dienoyl-CoA reductase/sulfur reductase-like enzyme